MRKFLLLAFILTACIHIEKMPSAKVDDGYSSLSTEELNRIKQASSSSTGQELNPVRWINAEDLKQISKGKRSWVIIWASWCPHSINLLETKVLYYSDSLRNRLAVIPVAQNINLDYQLSFFKKMECRSPLYIINSLKYGTDENTKVRSFLRELKVDESLIIKSTPINLLIDETGKVLKIKYGEGIDDEFFR